MRKANSGQHRLPELTKTSKQKPSAYKTISFGSKTKRQVNFSVSEQQLDLSIDEVLVSEFMPQCGN